MTQGANLPALHTWNIQSTLYVDAVNGNDVTGTGATGAPFQTLQKVADYLKATHTWPATGDQAVKIRAGTYKAASTQINTLTLTFSVTGRAPSSTRFLIWAPDTGATGLVKIESPDGVNTAKYCLQLTGALNSYTIFSGIEFWGGDVRKGPTDGSSGNSVGIYYNSTVAAPIVNCEIVDCSIHGFQAGFSSSPATIVSAAAGAFAFQGADGWKCVRTSIYDIGTTTGTTLNNEHGLYLEGRDNLILNCDIYNVVNGFNIQFYRTNSSLHNGEIVANCTLDTGFGSGIVINPNSTSCTFSNNIFSNHTGRGASSYGINFLNAGNLGVANVVDHNIYFNNTGGNRDRSPTGWTFTNETTGNPLFTGPKNHRIASTSPAIGYTDTNWAPATDIIGSTRPAGAEDAGAYEFTLSNVNIVIVTKLVAAKVNN